VVEDLHWSDESTLEFLLFFARKTAASRLLVLLTYRSEEVSQPLRSFLAQLDRERLRQEIALVRLTRANTETMLQTILPGTASLPAGMLDALYGLTEGNPFFLEEVLKVLMMAEELVWEEDGWHWKRADTWRISLSLQDAVELRLNRVSAGARRVLRLAAVAGRRFDLALLQQITQYNEASLLELMKEAMAAQLVIEESSEQFAFRHALTQQAISGGLLARERRALHGTIARAIEHLYAEILDAHCADQAFHCADWIAEFVAIQIQAYALQGQPKLAEAALQEMLTWGRNPSQETERYLLLVQAELALVQHQPELALQWCEQLLSTAPQRAGETEEHVIPRLWKCQGEALAALGRGEEAIQVLKEARRGALLQQYLPLYWQIERSLGRTYQKQRYQEEAQQAFSSACHMITILAESIKDAALREHFEQTARATLPKEKSVSTRRTTARQYDGLTEREREVATRIGQGKSNAEIADLLVVSKRTVETYVSSVLSKLGLTSRSQIALWARDKELTSREP
ncbi:MAG TPA: LuxR C-terminal-related transcriptional regulator, partial [Ktedonobacteraceae bacterium]|nr:LuxR C-terminal-related transcriptional regulator [Ktedonobacteraceae bacterium]